MIKCIFQLNFSNSFLVEVEKLKTIAILGNQNKLLGKIYYWFIFLKLRKIKLDTLLMGKINQGELLFAEYITTAGQFIDDKLTYPGIKPGPENTATLFTDKINISVSTDQAQIMTTGSCRKETHL